MFPMMWKQSAGHQARPLPGDLAVLAAPAVAPVLHRVVVVLPDGDLLEAVPLYPAVLVRPSELRANLRREPVEQVEDGRGVAAEKGPCQAEGLAAHVCKDAGGDALGAPSPLELVHLVGHEQVEEALHPVLDVVGQRVAGRAGPVRLPEGRAAAGAGVLPAVSGRRPSVARRPCRRSAPCSRGSRGPGTAPQSPPPAGAFPWTWPTAVSRRASNGRTAWPSPGSSPRTAGRTRRRGAASPGR